MPPTCAYGADRGYFYGPGPPWALNVKRFEGETDSPGLVLTDL